jgi:hypothetical protein
MSIINTTLFVVNDGSASDYVVTLASLNRVDVPKCSNGRIAIKTGNNRVVTITSINNTLVVNDASASDYVVTLPSVNGERVLETIALPIPLSTISHDYVFSITGIYKPFVIDAAITTFALDGVITITSIESEGGIVETDGGVGEEVTKTTDSVVAVSSIEDTTDTDCRKATRTASYYNTALPDVMRYNKIN